MTKKILIVEDEKDILELLTTLFRLEGYEIICAKDGEEALKIAKENKIDIILLDIQLPKLKGPEVCNSVKSDPGMSHIKILLMSGVTQNSEQIAQKAGADGFIAKPFSSVALMQKVEKLIGKE
jgi:CheY-like chemotaxis protein